MLVEGEAGIGKTRFLDAVADLAVGTGGRVLRGRCHPRSARSSSSRTSTPYGPPCSTPRRPPWPRWSATTSRPGSRWSPSSRPWWRTGRRCPRDVDLQRRQAYDAVVAVLRRLALDRPVLLTIDDLQDGGAATVDLLGYLAGRLGGARVLVVAAVRAEDAAGRRRGSPTAPPSSGSAPCPAPPSTRWPRPPGWPPTASR